MSVGSTTRLISYTIDDTSTAPLAVDFRFDAESWLNVYYVPVDGESATLLVLGSDYTIGGNGVEIEGTVTLTTSFLASITTGQLTIARLTPALQTLDLEYNTRLPSAAVEKALDWQAMALQDRDPSPGGIGGRAIVMPVTEPPSNSNVLAIPEARKGKPWWGNPVTGKLEFAEMEDFAPAILAYYGITITTDDVLAAISAIAPLFRATPPDSSTEGKGGQLAIVPEYFGVTISGTLNPDATGPLLPWKTDGTTVQKVWFTTTGENPQDNVGVVYQLAWTNIFTISEFSGGVPTGKAWIALNGNSGTTAEGVTSWLALGGATGSPSVSVTDLVPARVWVNLSQTGEVPNWVEIGDIQEDRSKTHVVIIGNSISVGQGTLDQSWPGQLSEMSFFQGCTIHNLAVNGRSIATMDSTYESEVSQYHPDGTNILKTYVFLVSDASNNYAAQSSDPLSAAQIITHRDSILNKAKDGGCTTFVGTTLRRTDTGVGQANATPADEAVRQEINYDCLTNDLADFHFDLDGLLPDPDDTLYYAAGGIHPNNTADTIIASVINGILESKGTYTDPQGPKLSGGNSWREQQTFTQQANGSSDFSLLLQCEDVGTRLMGFGHTGSPPRHILYLSPTGFSSFLSYYDTTVGNFVLTMREGKVAVNGADPIETLDVAGSFSANYLKPKVGPFADDAAAAAGGVPVNGQYNKTGGAVSWRQT